MLSTYLTNSVKYIKFVVNAWIFQIITEMLLILMKVPGI